MTFSSHTTDTPRQVLERFYEAEKHYMQTGGANAGASFDAMGATLDPNVVLHQSPDLPFGGDYIGFERYKKWSLAMSTYFDKVDVQQPDFFEKDGTVVVVCRLITRSRSTGAVMDLPMVQVITVKNGKITEFRPFYWNVPEFVAAAKSNYEQEIRRNCHGDDETRRFSRNAFSLLRSGDSLLACR